MSSTPVAPVPAAPSVPTFLSKYIAFVKVHEKLLIVGLAGFLVFHFYSKTIDAWVNHDKTVAQAAAAVVKSDDASTLVLKAQVAALQLKVDAQNAIIEKQIATSQAQTKVQQQKDATLSPTELSARLTTLLKITPAEITSAVLSDHLDFSPAAAIATAQQLETIPELESEVLSLRTELSNDNTIITKQGELITQLNKDLSDEKTGHAKDVADLKAQNHKSWISGFKWGFVSGITLGLVAHVHGI